jgi:hypothetical protein
MPTLRDLVCFGSKDLCPAMLNCIDHLIRSKLEQIIVPELLPTLTLVTVLEKPCVVNAAAL